jgi:hypothetical protein
MLLPAADVLVNAFDLIADKFPKHPLKIVGRCRSGAVRQTCRGYARIGFHDPVEYEDVLDLMVHSCCSRTEAMDCVVLKAMPPESRWLSALLSTASRP